VGWVGVWWSVGGLGGGVVLAWIEKKSKGAMFTEVGD